MTERSNQAKAQTRLSSAALTSNRPTSTTIRSRSRRHDAGSPQDARGLLAQPNHNSEFLSAYDASKSYRSASPATTGHRASSGPRKEAAGGDIAQFLGESWTQSWTSVQEFASGLLTTGGSQSKAHGLQISGGLHRQTVKQDAWGPLPPSRTPALDAVATGNHGEREAALRAAKTASVLESHDGVNGGLDISGNHKRRNSDEICASDPVPDEHLVYIHDVQPEDTYAGITLRYKCREDIFRKSNGLWSRDNIQTRKRLIIPVDACEIRGRPCEAPSWHNGQEADLLAPTPAANSEAYDGSESRQDDFFSRPVGEDEAERSLNQEEDKPWTHVRWVQIDSFRKPVEIGRVPRQALGYFPPRRKRSIRTGSSLSTPRRSSDLSGPAVAPIVEGSVSRRPSSLSGRPAVSVTSMSSRSRGGSESLDDRPAWMRRPGGVGSMSRKIKAPGPDKDYFNSWTRKHIPGLNIESLPSMSVMGSETAHFGFAPTSSDIVESPFEDGRDVTPAARNGTGLDRAAAAVETWLRGALAKRPSTPLLGGRVRSAGLSGDNDISDLIELTDTASDDGRQTSDGTINMMSSLSLMSSGRSDGNLPTRGRTRAGSGKRLDHSKDD